MAKSSFKKLPARAKRAAFAAMAAKGALKKRGSSKAAKKAGKIKSKAMTSSTGKRLASSSTNIMTGTKMGTRIASKAYRGKAGESLGKALDGAQKKAFKQRKKAGSFYEKKTTDRKLRGIEARYKDTKTYKKRTQARRATIRKMNELSSRKQRKVLEKRLSQVAGLRRG